MINGISKKKKKIAFFAYVRVYIDTKLKYKKGNISLQPCCPVIDQTTCAPNQINANKQSFFLFK